jgi:flagellar protein FlaG
METKAAAGAPAPDPGKSKVERNAPVAASRGEAAPPPAPGPGPVEMRLVIEMDQASGSYVYKTINRATGEVVQQLPRAEVLKLKGESAYEAGTVVRTKA